MSPRFSLTEEHFNINASLDPMQVLERMGFTPKSVYREGDLIRIHCPIHKDLVRKSLILDARERTFRCTYARCPAHEGGLLLELAALYFACDINEVHNRLYSESVTKSTQDLVFRGEMFINQGRAQEALAYFEQACALNPNDEITRCKLAALYLELNMKDEAFQEYLRAAESYAVRGELEKTLSIYNILIMLQPGAVKARKQLALLFSRLNRPDAAAEQMKWVVDFYIAYKQTRGAIDALEQLLETDPNNPTAHRLLGMMLNQDGKRVPAMKEYEDAARLFVEAGDRDNALAAIEEGLAIAPGNRRLQELRDQASRLSAKAAAPSSAETAQAEEAFIAWIHDLDTRLGPPGPGAMAPTETSAIFDTQPGAPAPPPAAAPRPAPAPPAQPPLGEIDHEIEAPVTPAPLPAGARPAARPYRPQETAEIGPEDRRVIQALADMENLTDSQIAMMHEEVIKMFNDTRRTYEDGLLTDWEMRIVKEFYKAFNLAVEIRSRRAKSPR